MRPSGWSIPLLVVGCLGLCSGCGSEGKRLALSGSVKFQGKLVERGNITFLTTSGSPGPVCGAPIQAGRYDIPASQGLEPGTYRVLISWSVPGETLSPEEKAAGSSPRAKELIPPKYNSPNSPLMVEVKVSGTNQFDFDLE